MDGLDPRTYDEISSALATGKYKFTYYSIERGKANDYYSNATTFVTVAVVNHVVSAVDAAWSAHSHNKSVHVGMDIHRVPYGFTRVYVPAAKVEYSF